MNSIIYKTDTGETIREVKNLRWLLKHSKEVSRIEVNTWGNSANYKGQLECTLTAYLTNGRAYRTSFLETKICLEWLDRPVFRGTPLAYQVPGYGTIENVCGHRFGFQNWKRR